MNDSIYAPPEADVGNVETDESTYYVVGARKFFLLALLTANGYLIYWFYRNWMGVKRRDRSNIWPAPRGLFYIFFTHSLFSDVDDNLKRNDQSFDWSPRGLASLIVFTMIFGAVMGNLSQRWIGSPLTDILNIAVFPAISLMFIKAQRAINLYSGDPEGTENQGLTVVNWVWMVLGSLWWMLMLFGLYAAVFAPELLAE